MRVGIDVGGTFTDLVARDDASGFVRRIKVPSTPARPERAALSALARLVEEVDPASIRFFGHASTVATNALLGQIGLELPRVALLTTAGFRDVLEIGRQNRSELYNLFVQRPKPLVPRQLRFGVTERLTADGRVLVPLDVASLAPLCAELVGHDVSVVAVSYLHAYADGAHERATRDELLRLLPHLAVVLSSEVDPEYREYERTSTTVVHALLGPLVRGYLKRLASGTRACGVPARTFVMQSNGGMTALETVALRPASSLESGPAAGVVGAATTGKRLGLTRILSFDMGGTTAKAGIVAAGEPQVVHEFEAAGRSHSGRAVKGSGYPVRLPFIDLAEVSAGGGTIAFVDAGGALRVGPLSAGADPGPAAYGRGSAATVTDADLVLGRLNPHALLSGELRLDPERAGAALDALLPSLPELNRASLACGIVRLVDSEMAKVLRIVSVERGHDPREFTLIAFGGSGPLHACALAAELGIRSIVVPPDPGLFSAHGLLAADVRVSALASFLERLEEAEPARIEAAFATLERHGAGELEKQDIPPERRTFVRELELRYAGQSFELSVATSAPFDAHARGRASADFHERHRRAYGFAADDPLELVNLRSAAVGAIPRPHRAAATAPGAPSETAADVAGAAAVVRERRTVVEDSGVVLDAAVYDRLALRPGMRFEGPALVEQYDATTWIAPGWGARIGGEGDLLLERSA
jgi:N-methylhydantoinase A